MAVSQEQGVHLEHLSQSVRAFFPQIQHFRLLPEPTPVLACVAKLFLFKEENIKEGDYCEMRD